MEDEEEEEEEEEEEKYSTIVDWRLGPMGVDVTVITATATAMEDAPVDAVEDIVKKGLLPLSSRCLSL